jgi:hypothetical protein
VNLSGSKLALLPSCQYFARDDVERRDLETRDAVMGRAGHTVSERIIDGVVIDLPSVIAMHGLTEAEGLTIERKIPAVRDFIEKNRNWSWRSEIAFGYNFETGEGVELPKGEYHRDYRQCPPGFVPMTLDVVGVTQVEVDGIRTPCAFVLDWKWGYGESVDAPRNNGQLCGQALAVAAAYACDLVLVVVAHVRDDIVELKESLFDPVTLAKVHTEGAERIAKIPTSQPQPGSHCTRKFCNAIHACPETVRAMASVEETALAAPAPFKLTPNIVSPEHAAWMIDARAACRKALDIIDDALEHYADEIGGIPHDGGTWQKVLVPTETPDLTVPGAIATLEAMGLGHAVKPSTNWKALGKQAADAREALRVLGALKKNTQARYEDRKAG